MAYAVVHHFPGGTQAQYEASIAAVHPADGSLPDGQIFHAAGPSTGGWTVTAVHQSRESSERFRDEVSCRRCKQGSKEGSRRHRKRPHSLSITSSRPASGLGPHAAGVSSHPQNRHLRAAPLILLGAVRDMFSGSALAHMKLR